MNGAALIDRGFFIDGKWQQPKGVERFDIADPATGEPVGSTLLADERIVDQAVRSATSVAAQIAGMPAAERAAILMRAADNIDQRAEKMALLLTREQGKPISDNMKEILFGAEVLRYYAGEATRIFGSLRPASSPAIKNLVSYHPDRRDRRHRAVELPGRSLLLENRPRRWQRAVRSSSRRRTRRRWPSPCWSTAWQMPDCRAAYCPICPASGRLPARRCRAIRTFG